TDFFCEILTVDTQKQVVGTHGLGAIELALSAANGDHARPVYFCETDKHHADGSQSQDGNVVAAPDRGFVEAAQHTGERLDQRRILIIYAEWNLVQIALHDTARN